MLAQVSQIAYKLVDLRKWLIFLQQHFAECNRIRQIIPVHDFYIVLRRTSPGLLVHTAHTVNLRELDLSALFYLFVYFVGKLLWHNMIVGVREPGPNAFCTDVNGAATAEVLGAAFGLATLAFEARGAALEARGAALQA